MKNVKDHLFNIFLLSVLSTSHFLSFLDSHQSETSLKKSRRWRSTLVNTCVRGRGGKKDCREGHGRREEARAQPYSLVRRRVIFLLTILSWDPCALPVPGKYLFEVFKTVGGTNTKQHRYYRCWSWGTPVISMKGKRRKLKCPSDCIRHIKVCRERENLGPLLNPGAWVVSCTSWQFSRTAQASQAAG